MQDAPIVTAGRERRRVVTADPAQRTEALINARSCLKHAVYLRHFALAVDTGQVESFMAEVARQGRRTANGTCATSKDSVKQL